MNIFLIGNYEPDRQKSMQRFAQLLFDELRSRNIQVELRKPPIRFGRFRFGSRFFDKWLGYLDKLVLFPRALRRELAHRGSVTGANTVLHICDHSYAAYVRHFRDTPALVTCHDLLAVRSAFGEFPENPTGLSGRTLQRMIVRGLSCSPHVACVSEATRGDLLRLTQLPAERVSVVPNGLNYPYRPMPDGEAAECVARLLAKNSSARRETSETISTTDRIARGFILHVGGNQWYKNRPGVLRIYRRLTELMPDAPDLVIAGHPLLEQWRAWIEDNGLQHRIHAIEGADNEDLRALYSRAELLLFPSLAEGFGWPIIEAQGCGCPVVTADHAPMSDIGGTAAWYCNPKNHFAAALLLQRALAASQAERERRRAESRSNIQRFSTERMVDGYLKLYARLLRN